MKTLAQTALLSTAIVLASCASIFEGSEKKVDIRTAPASSASCNAKNARESKSLVAPGTISIKGSKSDLEISCVDNTTGATGTKTVSSDIESWVLGNILIGGPIGLGVDFGITGAGYDYPDNVEVYMPQPAAQIYAPTYAAPYYYAPNALSPQAGEFIQEPVGFNPYTAGYSGILGEQN